MSLPAFPARGCTWPLSVHAFPTHWLFLRPKPCLTELAAAVAVCLATKKLSSEDLCLAISAVRTTHGYEPPFQLDCESFGLRPNWDILPGSMWTCGHFCAHTILCLTEHKL